MKIEKTFEELKETVCKAYAARRANWTQRTDYLLGIAMQELAEAIALSVLNKCIDPRAKAGNTDKPQKGTPSSWSSVLQDLKRDVPAVRRDAARRERLEEQAYSVEYDADGNAVRIIRDSKASAAIDKLCGQTVGDGFDLVQTANLAILSELDNQQKRAPGSEPDFDLPYFIRRLKSHVWIKREDSRGGWETTETKPIKETYKAVRREIQRSKALAVDPRNGYSYLAELSRDEESGIDETIYIRCGKYADIGGYETDANGRETVYTADPDIVEREEEIIRGLGLTYKQNQILSLRRQGKGNKSIATYFGISLSTVKEQMRAIDDKFRTAYPEIYDQYQKRIE